MNDFFRAIFGIGVTLGLAFLMGATRNNKHPAATVYLFFLVLAVLIVMRVYL